MRAFVLFLVIGLAWGAIFLLACAGIAKDAAAPMSAPCPQEIQRNDAHCMQIAPGVYEFEFFNERAGWRAWCRDGGDKAWCSVPIGPSSASSAGSAKGSGSGG